MYGVLVLTGPGDQTVSRWLSGAPEGCVNLPTRGESFLPRTDGSAGPSPLRAKRRQRLDAVRAERQAVYLAAAVVDAGRGAAAGCAGRPCTPGRRRGSRPAAAAAT